MSLRSSQFRKDRIGWVAASCLLVMGVSMGVVGKVQRPGHSGIEPPLEPAADDRADSDWDDDWGPTLRTLAWLGGHWQQSSEDGLVEELWMPARGGVMLGLRRTVRGRHATARFEFLRIEERDADLFLVSTVDGEKPAEFRLVEGDHDRAVFANPENTFPKRIEYERKGTTRLVALIWGDEAGPAWNFVRTGDIE